MRAPSPPPKKGEEGACCLLLVIATRLLTTRRLPLVITACLLSACCVFRVQFRLRSLAVLHRGAPFMLACAGRTLHGCPSASLLRACFLPISVPWRSHSSPSSDRCPRSCLLSVPLPLLCLGVSFSATACCPPRKKLSGHLPCLHACLPCGFQFRFCRFFAARVPGCLLAFWHFLP